MIRRARIAVGGACMASALGLAVVAAVVLPDDVAREWGGA